MNPGYDRSLMHSRVAVIAYHSSPLAEPGAGDSGGMTVYVRALAEASAALGAHTDIFTRATESPAHPVQIVPGVRIVPIAAGPARPVSKDEQFGFLDDFVDGVRAFAAMQRIGYDVVHSHYWQSGLAGTRLARLWDVPHVHSSHTLGRVKNSFLPQGDVAEPVHRLAGEAEVIATADVLLASTDEEYRQLVCLYGAPHDRLKVLHPGVDHARFHPGDRVEARAELNIAPSELSILYAGRIQPLKGLELAVRALEQLVPSLGEEVSLTIVGGASGPSGVAEIERLVTLADALGFGGRVVLVGPQRHDRLPTYYRAADVLVMCSHSESFGLTALEAHACGTPVVATAVGGLAHVVRDGTTGFLVGDRDPATFAGRLKTVLADDELRARMRVAAHAASRAFSWERTAATLLELYACLIEERQPEACVC